MSREVARHTNTMHDATRAKDVGGLPDHDWEGTLQYNHSIFHGIGLEKSELMVYTEALVDRMASDGATGEQSQIRYPHGFPGPSSYVLSCGRRAGVPKSSRKTLGISKTISTWLLHHSRLS